MFHAVIAAAAEAEPKNPLIPEIYDIIWSTVVFVVILFFFWKLVLPRMQKLLDDRAEAIEGNIAKADDAQRKAVYGSRAVHGPARWRPRRGRSDS